MAMDSGESGGAGGLLSSITGTTLLSIASAVAVTIVFAPSVYSGTMPMVEPIVVEGYGEWVLKPLRIIWGVVSGFLTYSVIQVAGFGLMRLASAWFGGRFSGFF